MRQRALSSRRRDHDTRAAQRSLALMHEAARVEANDDEREVISPKVPIVEMTCVPSSVYMGLKRMLVMERGLSR